MVAVSTPYLATPEDATDRVRDFQSGFRIVLHKLFFPPFVHDDECQGVKLN